MNALTNEKQGNVSLLRELQDRDTETGLLTSIRIYRVLLGEIARSERYGNPLSCILLKLHGLELIPGDTRLELCCRLADVMRNTDFAGVWDLEGFLLVLPETGDDGARQFAQKVEQTLQELIDGVEKSNGSTISIAIRVTTWQSGDDADAMLDRLQDSSSA